MGGGRVFLFCYWSLPPIFSYPKHPEMPWNIWYLRGGEGRLILLFPTEIAELYVATWKPKTNNILCPKYRTWVTEVPSFRHLLKKVFFLGGRGDFLYISIFFQLQCWKIWANLYNHWLRPGASGQAEDVAEVDREGETRLEAVLVLLLVNFHN